jgi:hypothetical protein
MEHRRERLDLLPEPLDELARAADRQRGNDVDRLVGLELDALAADRGHRLDDVRAKAEQAELEHLEEANRPRSDDEDVRGDHAPSREF